MIQRLLKKVYRQLGVDHFIAAFVENHHLIK